TIYSLDLGAQVVEQGLHQQQIGRIVVDAENLRSACVADDDRLVNRALRVDQFHQRLVQLARAGRLGLQLGVGIGERFMEQPQLGSRAQHQSLAAELVEIPD